MSKENIPEKELIEVGKEVEELEGPVSAVELNGRSIDISKNTPLRLRDWKALERQGISSQSLKDAKITDLVEVIYHVLHGSDETVTMDEIDDLELTDPAVTGVLRSLTASKIDRPT